MLDISELATLSGCPASKLRYYEDVGLIRSIGRRGLKRLFEDEVIERLSIIHCAQIAGFSLQEIKGIIGAEGRPDLDRQTLLDKADQVDRKIAQLAALRNGLRHVANCSAQHHLECPRFKRIMHATLRKERRQNQKNRGR